MTRQVEYALQLMIALSQQTEKTPLSLRAFASESNISFLFLQKIALCLRKAELITAQKGAQGGYFLLKKDSDISIQEIIEAVEGTYGMAQCMRGEQCDREHTCDIKPGISKVNQQVSSYMAQTSLFDIASAT